MKRIEKIIQQTDDQEVSKVNWTNAWSKKYPVLETYQNKINVKDYEKKVSRGFADQTTKREAVYAWVNFSETTNDYTIQKYVPKLREKMGL